MHWSIAIPVRCWYLPQHAHIGHWLVRLPDLLLWLGWRFQETCPTYLALTDTSTCPLTDRAAAKFTVKSGRRSDAHSSLTQETTWASGVDGRVARNRHKRHDVAPTINVFQNSKNSSRWTRPRGSRRKRYGSWSSECFFFALWLSGRVCYKAPIKKNARRPDRNIL